MIEAIKVLKQFESNYQGVYSELQPILADISGEIQTAISRKGFTINKDYIISARVKEPESLYEKILRYNKVKKIIGSSIDKDMIFQYLKNDRFFNDVIGLKLKTLIMRPDEFFNIVFPEIRKALDIVQTVDNSKTEMKNGLIFYKVYGKKNEIQFELQCSSVIQSAWSDIEHRLFYKDYTYYYEKDNNQQIINHIKNTLIESEEMLRVADNTRRNYQNAYISNKIKYDISSSIEQSTKDILHASLSLDNLYKLANYLIQLGRISIKDSYVFNISEDSFKLNAHGIYEENISRLLDYNYKMMIEFSVLNQWDSKLNLGFFFDCVFEYIDFQCNARFCMPINKDILSLINMYLNESLIQWKDEIDIYNLECFYSLKLVWNAVIEILNNFEFEESTVLEAFSLVFKSIYEQKGTAAVISNDLNDIRVKTALKSNLDFSSLCVLIKSDLQKEKKSIEEIVKNTIDNFLQVLEKGDAKR